MSEKILEVKDLNVSFHTYAGTSHAVRGIDFHLNQGETLAIVGESGCGKTVTSKAIMGLLPTPQTQIKKDGDTIGGIVETVVGGVPVGLGSYVQWDKKLDAKIAAAVVSINAFKGVEFGLGFKDGYLKGSQVMDEILWNEEEGYTRRTNNLGGFEGGMSNGQPIVVRGVMKPIPTLYKPLMSVDIETHEPYKATVERSDPTALPAAGVVMESVVATVIADEILDKFSSDNLEELKDAVARHRDYVKHF